MIELGARGVFRVHATVLRAAEEVFEITAFGEADAEQRVRDKVTDDGAVIKAIYYEKTERL